MSSDCNLDIYDIDIDKSRRSRYKLMAQRLDKFGRRNRHSNQPMQKVELQIISLDGYCFQNRSITHEEIRNNFEEMQVFYQSDVRSSGFNVKAENIFKGMLAVVNFQRNPEFWSRAIVVDVRHADKSDSRGNHTVNFYFFDERLLKEIYFPQSSENFSMCARGCKHMARNFEWPLPHFIRLKKRQNSIGFFGTVLNSEKLLAYNPALQNVLPKDAVCKVINFSNIDPETDHFSPFLPNFQQNSFKNRYSIIISHVVSPDDFYFNLVSPYYNGVSFRNDDLKSTDFLENGIVENEYAARWHLHREICSFFEKPENEQRYNIPNPDLIVENLICALMYTTSKFYCRVKVLRKYNADSCRVRCIDSGREMDAFCYELRFLAKRFLKLPPLTHRARLNRLISNSTCSSDWANRALYFFVEATSIPEKMTHKFDVPMLFCLVRRVYAGFAYCHVYSPYMYGWVDQVLIEQGVAAVDRDLTNDFFSIPPA